MTATQYRKSLKRLGISVVGAGQILGITRRHSQRIASGRYEVPPYAVRILKIIEKYNVDLKDLQS